MQTHTDAHKHRRRYRHEDTTTDLYAKENRIRK